VPECKQKVVSILKVLLWILLGKTVEKPRNVSKASFPVEIQTEFLKNTNPKTYR
jgi:hypothetical protein